MNAAEVLRQLPSVDELLRLPPLSQAESQLGHALAVKAARQALDRARELTMHNGTSHAEVAVPEPAALAQEASQRAWSVIRPALRPVINATGVVIHTNLGRAPLSQSAIAAMAEVAAGYSSIEMDLVSGRRGERHQLLEGVLRELLDVEAAMVVNNNASAVLLALTALARGKEVILSRGEAVEIGGAFRVPDIMRRSGARLVEVGTTNRTYVRDYEDALTDRTAGFLAVHSSNFRVVGFVHTVAISELGELARRRSVPLLHDLGSGCLLDTRQFGLGLEPTAQESVRAGAGLICFSGDKLLGGPQAGIIVGRKDLLDKLKREPLARAMRVDKLTVAALHATLVEYLKGAAVDTIPVWRMIASGQDHLRARAERWAGVIPGSDTLLGRSAIGGGSLPEETLPTTLLRLPATRSADRLLAALRAQDPPLIARIEDNRVVLDPRTVLERDEQPLLLAVKAALAA